MDLLKFEPLLKQTLWGGEKITAFKHLDSDLENVGESWEISGVKDNETIVANGTEKGKSLNQLVREQKGALVGQENYERFGDEFPLLIKFIDARQDLSIQVHPTDEIAHRQGKSRGKTEMWVALESDKGAQLYNGLKQQITPEQYKEMVENDTITDALARYEVNEGDVFFIPAGRIHAIGAGCFVAEIQQTSDVTYRIYDFKRKDKNGNYRELHTKEAAESIDYTVLPNYRTEYQLEKNVPQQVAQCPYFTTAIYDLTEPMMLDYSELDSFVILIGLKGEGTLTADGKSVSLNAGETVLIPATAKEIKVEGTVKFLETYV
ncbi:type I phosphomannose isomerase catalytic subunit [Xylanibacter brevis]|uniref:type I phosphomannose isomerase catalytic subunit n=1 Tax=Xylanibacter brevis TaxID=83231 RepID=UPI000485951E|nr:type I phosphomannose isomerase catalytic subunit [Xylanibacter brevis]